MDSQTLTEDEFWASAAVRRAAAAAIGDEPVAPPRAARRGVANTLIDMAKKASRHR